MVERVDAARLRLGIMMDQQFHARVARGLVAQIIHRPELPGGVDMEQREGRRRGIEGLLGQMQHHRRILAHRIQHHRPLRLRHNLPQYMYALRL